MVYTYDGSFPGFLSAVYTIYHDGTSHVEDIRRESGEGDLFFAEKEVPTNFDEAQKVASAFLDACGRTASQWLFRAFLYDAPKGDMELFRFLREGFRLKKKIYGKRLEPWAWNVFQRASATGDEAGTFLGLVRFSELAEGTLYAEIRPTHDILPLLANHFRRRLGNEDWAIHDIGRRHVLYGHRGTILFAQMTSQDTLEYSGEEESFRRLWRGYYQHMAITERYNPALRRSFMPEKYWECLTEMKR